MKALPFLTTVLALASATPAAAQEPALHTAHDDAVHSYVVGARGGLLASVGGEETHSLPGGALFAEAALFHHAFELELAAGAFFGEHETVLPLDLRIKKPLLHGGPWAPFLAIGPTAVVITGEEHTEVEFGGTAGFGTYYWFNHAFGLVAEASYNLLVKEKVEPEVGAGLGLVVGW